MIVEEIKAAYDKGNEHAQAMWGEVNREFNDSVFYLRFKDAEIEDLCEVLRVMQKVNKSDWRSKDKNKWLPTYEFTEALDNKDLQNLWGNEYWKELNKLLRKSF